MTRVKLFRKPASNVKPTKPSLPINLIRQLLLVSQYADNGSQARIDKIDGSNRPSGFVQHVMKFSSELQLRKERLGFI